ncbi:hypothetical protein X777_09440 [Ooceraea biroi]|uniref:Nucleic-acid-binding protein from mobile element jockey n=1 Tax=Ooceraea biroi TaxID=2015173 RepID=A0A026W8P2_OOCBI|nr:hypothetical protein X777_09440 [Ooceraea biroi]
MDTEDETNLSFINSLKQKNNNRKVQHAQNIQQTSHTANSNQSHEGHMQSKRSFKVRPPPIHIFFQEPKDTWRLAKEITGDHRFHIKRINETKHTICNQVIRWEKLRRKNVIQCRRCQRIGPSTANCNLKFRCVKCKGNHNPEGSVPFGHVDIDHGLD